MKDSRIRIFYPAPKGLPVPVAPPAGSSETRKAILEADWGPIGGLREDRRVRTGALWLHGFIEEAHKVAQEDSSVEGSYWHALVHRSEGDFDNSLYWFGRVGSHAIFPELREQVEKLKVESSDKASAEAFGSLLSGQKWSPKRFVDLCRRAREGEFRDLDLLQRVAAVEYNLLMSFILSSL